MPLDRFMISPPDGGLQANLKPFMIPDEAFARLENAYVFRGRIRKRFGGTLLEATNPPAVGFEQLQSRLRIKIGTTDGFGTFVGTTPLLAGIPIATPAIGQLFSIGNEIFTVIIVAGPPAPTLSTGSGTMIFNGTTGGILVALASAFTDVYYYPSLPVMGLASFELPNINNEQLIAFDTRFAYEYGLTGFERLSTETTAGASTWVGSNSQFFWTTNGIGTFEYQNFLYVTNFDEDDPNFMRYFDGSTWTVLRPKVSSLVVGPPLVLDIFLDTCRMLVVFKNRMIALNTWESESPDGINYTQRHYAQRARYSTVLDSPVGVDSWRQDIPGKGSAIDAPTSESIVTSEFVKDRLIVYFERSTWEIVYTGNQANPFTWQRINTELGAESTFSVIPFDKVAIGVGNVGIHACNGSNVERIDDKIPDEIFDFNNETNEPERVYGIRDYFVEMIYWSFPDGDQDSMDFPFNNKVLVFNYKTGTWAINDDSITCFGYFQEQNEGDPTRWEDLLMEWQENANQWVSGPLQARFRNVIAGNQEGFVFLVDSESSSNCQALQITDIPFITPTIFTVINHNLTTGDFVLIKNCVGLTTYNDKIWQVTVIDNNTFSVVSGGPFLFAYQGGGTITRVSRIDILTKQYNFYADKGRNISVQKVDFLVDKTATGAITVDYFTSSSELSLVTEGQATGAILGNNVLETSPYVLYPLESQQEVLWHPIYLQADGEYVQLHLYLSDTQMVDANVSLENFELNAMTFYVMPTSERLQ